MKYALLFCLYLFYSCGPATPAEERVQPSPLPLPTLISLLDTNGQTIESRFPAPEGFVRRTMAEGSFGSYLQDLPLLPVGNPVYCYDGSMKRNQSVHVAVVDMDVGTRDLQQCADAVMRLRAEYLWEQEAYEDIQFHFTNGFLADYTRWRAGQRIKVQGNSVSWTDTGNASRSYKSFRSYLKMVFAYAGTLSLSKELEGRPLRELQIGDVFVQGGSPGHAVIVVDMVEHQVTGNKLLLLAQSYMPAQQIHILKNLNDKELSPWYDLEEMQEVVLTPEWRFMASDLKRF